METEECDTGAIFYTLVISVFWMVYFWIFDFWKVKDMNFEFLTAVDHFIDTLELN